MNKTLQAFYSEGEDSIFSVNNRGLISNVNERMHSEGSDYNSDMKYVMNNDSVVTFPSIQLGN